MNEQSPQVLKDLGAELERVARQKLSERPARRRRSTAARGVTAAITTLAVVCGIAAIVAIGGHMRPTTRQTTTPAPPPLEAAFVVFRRPAEPADRLPSLQLRVLEHSPLFRRLGLQPSQSRRLITTATVTVWIVPGSPEICLIAAIADGRPRQGPTATEGGCSSAAPAERQGAIGSFGDTVAGVLPDGSRDVILIRPGGQSTRLTLTNGAFAFRASPRESPIDVYYTSVGGAPRHIHLAPPPGYRVGQPLKGQVGRRPHPGHRGRR